MRHPDRLGCDHARYRPADGCCDFARPPFDELFCTLAMASDRHRIVDNINVFDLFDVHESERSARKDVLRARMRCDRGLKALRFSGARRVCKKLRLLSDLIKVPLNTRN
jgi:hypothetical protein